jgi:Domain of unknown function (DUF4190)
MPASNPSSVSPLDAHSSPVSESRTRSAASGRAIASLVCGIIAVLTCLLLLPGLILGVIAVAMGFSARGDCARRDRTAPWQANAGIGLGALALIVVAGLFIVAAVS